MSEDRTLSITEANFEAVYKGLQDCHRGKPFQPADEKTRTCDITVEDQTYRFQGTTLHSMWLHFDYAKKWRPHLQWKWSYAAVWKQTPPEKK